MSQTAKPNCVIQASFWACSVKVDYLDIWDLRFLGCYTAFRGNSLPMFRDNLSGAV